MSLGGEILGWWARELGDRERGASRALAARLRRAGSVEALAERAVQDLGRRLDLRDGERLARIACVLAEVRENKGGPLPYRLGGSDPVLSPLRFQRLMRADEAELHTALRRAIVMADRKCNVAALGRDLMFWNDETKTRWCFQYYHQDTPETVTSEAEA